MDPLSDLRDLVASIKADREAEKAKAGRDGWIKHVALSMIIIAVLAAEASQKGGSFSSTVMKQLNEATFNQAAASDQWSLYQAKGIKQSIIEGELDTLKLADHADAKRVAALTEKARRYDTEKKDVMKEAQGLEAKRDAARKNAERAGFLGSKLGRATILFQIAVSLGGVTLIVKRRWLWYCSLAMAAAATFQMVHVLFFS